METAIKTKAEINKEFFEHNLEMIKSRVQDENNIISESTKEEWRSAVDLLCELTGLQVKLIESVGDKSVEGDDMRDLRWRVSSNKKLELIALITKL